MPNMAIWQEAIEILGYLLGNSCVIKGHVHEP